MNTQQLAALGSKEIARRYREVFAEQQRADASSRWLFGVELRTLKLAHRVALESEKAVR